MHHLACMFISYSRRLYNDISVVPYIPHRELARLKTPTNANAMQRNACDDEQNIQNAHNAHSHTPPSPTNGLPQDLGSLMHLIDASLLVQVSPPASSYPIKASTTSYVLTLFPSPLPSGPVLLFLLSPTEPAGPAATPSPDDSCLENPGPLASAGVGNANGLGSTALFKLPLPPLLKSPHSLKKLLGLGNSSLDMYLLGNAEIGVSTLLRLS